MSPEKDGGAASRAPSRWLDGLPGLAAAAISFGFMALCVRIASSEMAGPQIAFFRFVGSLLLLLVLTGGTGLVPRRASYARLIARGVLGACAITLHFVAIALAGASTATMVDGTYPILIALLAVPLLGEPLSARSVWALATAVAGVVLVAWQPGEAASGSTLGVLVGVVGAVLAAGAIVTARALRQLESASLITTWFMAVGVVVTAPALLSGLPNASSRLLAALAATIAFSLSGQWLVHQALGRVEAAKAGLLLMGTVVVATVAEALWFTEPIGLRRIAGGAVVLLAIRLVSTQPPSAAAPAQPSPTLTEKTLILAGATSRSQGRRYTRTMVARPVATPAKVQTEVPGAPTTPVSAATKVEETSRTTASSRGAPSCH